MFENLSNWQIMKRIWHNERFFFFFAYSYEQKDMRLIVMIGWSCWCRRRPRNHTMVFFWRTRLLTSHHECMDDFVPSQRMEGKPIILENKPYSLHYGMHYRYIAFCLSHMTQRSWSLMTLFTKQILQYLF